MRIEGKQALPALQSDVLQSDVLRSDVLRRSTGNTVLQSNTARIVWARHFSAQKRYSAALLQKELPHNAAAHALT